ncbi:MAG: restriction endonuclease subunit S [Nitrospinae bacterium]|nr:restriction endonuclease subunit S [Nitrospinota bacterium]
MKPGWKVGTLKEFGEVRYGTRVVKTRDQGSKYPVYGGGGKTFQVDNYNRENCMIVARFGMSEECVRWVGGKFFLNDSGLSIHSRDSTNLSQEFLDTQLLARQKEIYEIGRGTAQKNLNVSALRDLHITVPPLEEQRRIVAVLDEAFDGLDRAHTHAEANLSDALDLFVAQVSSLFSCLQEAPQTPVGDVADHCLRKMLDKQKIGGRYANI